MAVRTVFSMRWLYASILCAVCLLALCSGAHAQQHAKRLILKDGSYQLANKWEVQGDRVHFYSAERYDWEDIPNSLVDWDATNKFNQQNPRGVSPNASAEEMQQADAEEKAERAKEEASRPLVAPGLRLPDSGGIFLLDHYHGQAQLVEVVQNSGELNKQMGKNIMHSIINPIPTGSKESIELKGTHAQVESHDTTPTIYVDLAQSVSDADDKQTSKEVNRSDRFKIVRVQEKKDIRVVSSVKISMLGKVTNQEDIVPTNAESVNGGEWTKLTPGQSLAPGEYALVEMLDEKTINMYVWDFGIDPNAPENASAWKPQPVKQQTAPSENTSGLTPRPR